MSAKSLAAHLTGLCWAVEHAGREAGLRKLQRWLNSPGSLVKPPVPSARGAVTILDLAAASDPDDYQRRLQHWADSVWRAYSPLHGLARAWIDEAHA